LEERNEKTSDSENTLKMRGLRGGESVRRGQKEEKWGKSEGKEKR